MMSDELLTSRTADGREFNIWKENMHIIRSLPFEMDSLDKTRKIRFLNPISSDKVLSPEKLSEMRGDIIVYPSEKSEVYQGESNLFVSEGTDTFSNYFINVENVSRITFQIQPEGLKKVSFLSIAREKDGLKYELQNSKTHPKAFDPLLSPNELKEAYVQRCPLF